MSNRSEMSVYFFLQYVAHITALPSDSEARIFSSNFPPTYVVVLKRKRLPVSCTIRAHHLVAPDPMKDAPPTEQQCRSLNVHLSFRRFSVILGCAISRSKFFLKEPGQITFKIASRGRNSTVGQGATELMFVPFPVGHTS